MRRTFPIHDLSNDEFEDLVASVCLNILGTGTIVFAPGKDGGRDAAFNGTAAKFPSEQTPLSGGFVIQAKHTANPAASCADSEFNRIVNGERSKIEKLIKDDGLEHYLIFTNRKKPASDGVKKEKALLALGLKSAHLLGNEQIRIWLTTHAKIWSDLGYDRFEKLIKLQTDDITAVVTAFHDSIKNGATIKQVDADLSYLQKSKKNKINKLSKVYFEEIRTRSLPYFKTIEDFLRNPRNVDLKDMYEDTADEIRRRLIAADPPFESFDAALTCIIDAVTENNPALKTRRRFATIFLHYMYYTCDIGKHADADETP